MKAVSVGVYDFNGDEWIKVSDLAKEMISKMLCFNSEIRSSPQKCLEHEWISKNMKSEAVDLPILQNALVKMKNFRADIKFQEAFWNFFVLRLATKDEKKDLLKSFQAIDKNGDGQLSKDELLTEYTRLYGETKAIEEVFIN